MSDNSIAAFPVHAAELDHHRTMGDQPLHRREAAFWTKVATAANASKPWAKQVQPAAIEVGPIGKHDGAFELSKTIEIPESWIGQELILELPAVDDIDVTLWNDAIAGTTLSRRAWSTPRRYIIEADLVRETTNVITIRGIDTGGVGGLSDEGAFQLSNENETLELAGDWEVRAGQPASDLPAIPYRTSFNQRVPTSLYNAMIAPLVPFDMQGVIWYQGESNREDPANYRLTFPSMIVDWRQKWDAPELPFYFVQLAPHDYDLNGEPDREVAETRDAQAAALNLPATGMALTADIGWRENIHPLNKWEVGRRLALFALRDIHGRADIEPDGPTFSHATPDGAQLHVRFSHVAGRLSAPGALDHFEIASTGGEFRNATATLGADGVSVVLTADGLVSPTRARYLWTDEAEATLFGGAGLPAAPFTTK